MDHFKSYYYDKEKRVKANIQRQNPHQCMIPFQIYERYTNIYLKNGTHLFIIVLIELESTTKPAPLFQNCHYTLNSIKLLDLKGLK